MAAIYSNGGNRWNILGFNFTKRDALSSVYKISMPLMPHECGTSKPCQSAQTASSERAQCVSGNGSSCRALNMT